MKTCPLCGNEIVNGVNGCSFYSECFDCKPIRYRAAPTRPVGTFEEMCFWENAILARQDAYYDD